VLMGALRQMDGSVHQGETKRCSSSGPVGGVGAKSDGSWCKLGVIEVNTINEMENVGLRWII